MSWFKSVLRSVKPIHAGLLAGSAGVMSSKKLSIYDPEEEDDERQPASIKMTMSTLPTNPVLPYITAVRKFVWSALDEIEENFNKVNAQVNTITDQASRTKRSILSIPDFIPPEEKMYSGIVVMGISGLAGTFLFGRHPALRKLLVVPGLTLGAGAVCYPQTSKKVANLAYNRVQGFDYQKYFSPAPQVTEELKAVQAKVADVEAKVAAEIKADVQAVQEKVAVVEAKVAEAVSSKKGKEVTITTAHDAAGAESVGKDLGQARQEDLETYTTRR